MWQNFLNAILGLAIMVVAFVGLTGSTLTWTLAGIGAAVALVGLWGALTQTDQRLGHA